MLDLKIILELSTIIALWNNGLSFLLSENQLLHFVSRWYENRSPFVRLLLKPVLGCVYCFSSFWGLLISFLYFSPMELEKVSYIAPNAVLSCIAAITLTGFLVNRFDRFG